jgi:hypothetical protein
LVGLLGRLLYPTLGLSEHDPSKYAVDPRRRPRASPVRRDPQSIVVPEPAGL